LFEGGDALLLTQRTGLSVLVWLGDDGYPMASGLTNGVGGLSFRDCIWFGVPGVMLSFPGLVSLGYLVSWFFFKGGRLLVVL